MPAKDRFHDNVKQALINDGWTITDDPFVIEYKGLRLFADFGAEKALAAEKGDRQIVVEVKVFGGGSFITELEKSLGQYSIYRTSLKRTAPERELFLAIPLAVYQDFFQRDAVKDFIADQQVRLLIFEPTTEEVVEWKS